MLRRIYLVLLSLILIAALSVALLDPQTVTGWTGRLSEMPILLRVPITLVVGAVLILLTFLAVRPGPRPSVDGLQMQGSGALTEVSVDSARQRILKVVGDVSDVVAVDAEVKPVRGRADVELQVTVWGHEVNLPAKQKEIDRALGQVINKQLGLKMAGKPRVHLRFHGEDEKQSAPASVPPPSLLQKPSVDAPTVAEPKVVEPISTASRPAFPPVVTAVSASLSQSQSAAGRAQPVFSTEEDADTLILDLKQDLGAPRASALDVAEPSVVEARDAEMHHKMDEAVPDPGVEKEVDAEEDQNKDL